MSGRPKVAILEQNGVEFDYNCEYDLDFLDVYEPSGTSKNTFTSDLLTKVVYYKNATQTLANRIGEQNITYNAGEQPTQSVTTIYDTTDGTILLKTITTTYTYSGDFPDATTVVQT